MKKIFSQLLLPVLLAAFCTAGCVSKVNLSEVLQQTESSEVRTAYHIWYTDNTKISALNCMEGEFIPAGTVIEPLEIRRGSYDIFGSVSVVDGSIAFRTADGKEYTMLYDERLMMMPIETFLRQLFTTESTEKILAKVPAAELSKVQAGKLEPGMHSASVLVVLGPPVLSRTTQKTNQSWLYWKTQDEVFRIIFKGDKIRQIVSLEEPVKQQAE